MPDWSSIASHLDGAGIPVGSRPKAQAIGGGDISAAWRFDTGRCEVFLKTGPRSAAEMFLAEAEGLAEIQRSKTLRVPAVLAVGQDDDAAFLALEWLTFERPDGAVEARLGEQLARMHRTVADRFGWHRDNTIGRTPQQNRWSADWVEFFAEHRLGYQLRLAAKNGYAGNLQQQGARLLRRLPAFFEDHAPLPSLLHGDLWGGNWACCDHGPVVFDPAVYYGDRESDLAMTRLFGGFGAAFYDAYGSTWPLRSGSVERQQLYQLYHVLNHLNLFGGAYLGRALALIETLLQCARK